MEMTKKIVFFDDLDDKGKEKAREWYKSIDDMPFLDEYIRDTIHEKMEEKGYIIDEYSFSVRYSLSYCQGDGVSFACMFHKGKHNYEAYFGNSNYVHEMTMDVKKLLEDYEEQDDLIVTERLRKIAKETERLAYKFIECEQSDENVDDDILVNKYTFTLEGERMNPDVTE